MDNCPLPKSAASGEHTARRRFTLESTRLFLLLALFALMNAGTLLAQEEPVIKLSEDGTWSVRLRYWSHQDVFFDAGGFMFLAEVESLGAKPPPTKEPPLRFQEGVLKVEELLYPKDGGPKELREVKRLRVEGMKGLRVGDRVVVLIDSEAYQGQYVINYHRGKCLIGIKLPREEDAELGPKEQKILLDYLRAPVAELEKMTDEQRYVWSIVDPEGLSQVYIRDLRMKWLQKEEAQK